MKQLYSETVNSLLEPVQKVIAYRENHLEPYDYHALEGVKIMLQIWKKNKNYFYSELFNGYCVEEIGEVAVKLDSEQKKSLTREFIEKIDSDWADMFPDFEDYEDEARDLVDFLESNFDMFFDNKTKYQYEAPDGTIISENSKISKSFKHFFDNKELVRALQDKYSALIQQDKMTGTLCASIHPLDYLSSSENNYKWRSCHALNGDFAGGNAGYMMDSCTMIFYLKGADDVKLPRFPKDVLWNDKKWRMLVFISDEGRMIWAGRQYPFASDELKLFVLEYLRKIYNEDYPDWSDNYVTMVDNHHLNEEYIFHPCGSLLPKKLFIKDAKLSAHYNDLLYSSYYTPTYTMNERYSIDSTDIPKVIVGHTPICACCGQKKQINTSRFICDECEEVLNPPTCKYCGKIVESHSDLTWVYGVGDICPECLEQQTQICEECGHRIRKGTSCSYCALSNVFMDTASYTISNRETGEVVIDWGRDDNSAIIAIDEENGIQRLNDTIQQINIIGANTSRNLEEWNEIIANATAELEPIALNSDVEQTVEIPVPSEYQVLIDRLQNYCLAQPPPINYIDNNEIVRHLI